LNEMLLLLRYTLIVLPAAATLQLSDQIPSTGRYVFLLLLFLIFLQQGDFRIIKLKHRSISHVITHLFLAGEILVLALGSFYFEGLLPFAFLSTLTSLYRRESAYIQYAILICAVMNGFAIAHMASITLFALNVAYISNAVLLYLLYNVTKRKQTQELAFDSLKQKHYELEETRSTMIDYAKKVQAHTQIDERNRIAHDLHDDLGHRLIRLKMMLEAAIRMPEEQQTRAYELITEVRDQLGESMETLRATVRRLKPADVEVSRYSLEGLIHEVASESGIQVDFVISGNPYALYPSEAFIMYRNAQEAITNAIRHGEATEVLITVAYTEQGVSMSVRNNGKLPDQSELRKGLGLHGMEERLRVVGGQLVIDQDPVFDIQSKLPRQRKEQREING
jgi:two-component system NarL family sensor kinase